MLRKKENFFDQTNQSEGGGTDKPRGEKETQNKPSTLPQAILVALKCCPSTSNSPHMPQWQSFRQAGALPGPGPLQPTQTTPAPAQAPSQQKRRLLQGCLLLLQCVVVCGCFLLLWLVCWSFCVFWPSIGLVPLVLGRVRLCIVPTLLDGPSALRKSYCCGCGKKTRVGLSTGHSWM